MLLLCRLRFYVSDLFCLIGWHQKYEAIEIEKVRSSIVVYQTVRCSGCGRMLTFDWIVPPPLIPVEISTPAEGEGNKSQEEKG